MAGEECLEPCALAVAPVHLAGVEREREHRSRVAHLAHHVGRSVRQARIAAKQTCGVAECGREAVRKGRLSSGPEIAVGSLNRAARMRIRMFEAPSRTCGGRCKDELRSICGTLLRYSPSSRRRTGSICTIRTPASVLACRTRIVPRMRSTSLQRSACNSPIRNPQTGAWRSVVVACRPRRDRYGRISPAASSKALMCSARSSHERRGLTAGSRLLLPLRRVAMDQLVFYRRLKDGCEGRNHLVDRCRPELALADLR